jgi:hypothetical protein
VYATKLFQPGYQFSRLDRVLPTMKSATKVGLAMGTLPAIIWPKLLAVWAFVEQWPISRRRLYRQNPPAAVPIGFLGPPAYFFCVLKSPTFIQSTTHTHFGRETTP